MQFAEGLYGGLKPPHPRDTHPRAIAEDYVDFEYRLSVLPKPTARVSRTVPFWPVYLNDQLGDCTEAAKAHAWQALTSVGTGKEISVTDNKVLSWYERDGGYVPGDPSTDNGCVVQDVLSNWQKYDTDLPITQFAELKNFYNVTNLKEALYLFGTVYLGIDVPQSAPDQFNQGLPWTYVPGSPIVGGHAIVLQEVAEPGQNDMLHVVTWGQLQPMSREFFYHYCSEAWVMISPDWFNSSGVDTDGFDLPSLEKDFSQLA